MSWLSTVFDDVEKAAKPIAAAYLNTQYPGAGTALENLGSGSTTVPNSVIGTTPTGGSTDPLGVGAGVNALGQTIVSTEQQARSDFVTFGIYVLLAVVMLIALYALIAPTTNISINGGDLAALAG